MGSLRVTLERGMLASRRSEDQIGRQGTGVQMGATSGGGTSGGGADLGIGPQLDKLRRDNSLADAVHDPTEDEPRIVRLPSQVAAHTVVSVPRTHHNWLAIIFVSAVILGAIVAIVVGAASTAQIFLRQ